MFSDTNLKEPSRMAPNCDFPIDFNVKVFEAYLLKKVSELLNRDGCILSILWLKSYPKRSLISSTVCLTWPCICTYPQFVGSIYGMNCSIFFKFPIKIWYHVRIERQNIYVLNDNNYWYIFLCYTISYNTTHWAFWHTLVRVLWYPDSVSSSFWMFVNFENYFFLCQARIRISEKMPRSIQFHLSSRKVVLLNPGLVFLLYQLRLIEYVQGRWYALWMIFQNVWPLHMIRQN